MSRHFGVEAAPSFRPTLQEFKDPYTYLRSIQPEAESFGICKIIPPDGWEPSFEFKTKSLFRPRVQQLNMMEGSTRAINNYLDQICRYHDQNGTPVDQIPDISSVPIDFLGLKNAVMSRAELKPTDWAIICFECDIDIVKNPQAPTIIYEIYMKWIYPYEAFLVSLESKPPQKMVVETTQTVCEATAKSSNRMGGNAVKAKVPTSKMAQIHSLKRQKLAAFPEAAETIAGSREESQVLRCDECEFRYNIPLAEYTRTPSMPEEWYCDHCITSAGKDFGFEEGPLQTLDEFKLKADIFKRKWFPKASTNREIESKFWEIVSSPYENVTIEYGADLHSSIHGSGFPSRKHQPDSSYANHPWNLNNFPLLEGSLLSLIRSDIPGMTVPWLYVGMLFSTFCWHVEDHHTPSINYLHVGDPKTWYGIPSSNAKRFEDVMRKTVPELFKNTPDLLFHITTILSPKTIRENNVKIASLDQHKGEFVVTWPQSYHAGFNQGVRFLNKFNVAEAVNFATFDWLKFGAKCVEQYRTNRKPPVFSHDELILAALEKPVINIDIAKRF